MATPFAYGPRSSHGGAVAAYQQLRILSKSHNVAVLAFDNIRFPSVSTEYIESVASYLVKVPLDVGLVQILAARLASWCGLAPYAASLNRSHAMRSAVESGIELFRPDLVILQFSQMAQYVDACRGVPCIVDIQDAFSVSAFRAYSAAKGFFRRIGALIDWLNWVSYEKRYLPRAAAVTTLSEQDLWGLRVYQPAIAGQVVGLPIELPKAAESPKAHPLRVGFVGSFGHAPNVEAVLYFVQEILPHVRSELPGVEFVVAGSNPPAKLVAAVGQDASFVGFVDDLAGFLGECAVVAIPLRSGGGIKIKTLEALAAGTAVVTTSIGAEGTGARDGEHLLIRDTPDDFAAALVAVIRDTDYAVRLGGAARTLVAERFSPLAWRSRFEAVAYRAAGIKPQ